MKRGFPLVAALTTLLGLLGAATASVARATPGASGCARVSALKTVFPRAAIVRFDAHSQIKRNMMREPFRHRKCGGWWTTYTGYRKTGAFAEVSVTLFKTRQDAVAAVWEPNAGPLRTLPNGVLVRTRVQRLALDSGAVSVVGNVLVSSQGSGPDDGYSGSVAVRAQMRIHRRIHAAV